MRIKSIKEKDERRELSRRALIGWMTAAGAALSVPLWKVWEIIEGSHGKAWAQDASCIPTNRASIIDFGVGALSWMTQVFPIYDIGENSNGNSYLFEGNRGGPVGTENPLWASPAGQLAMASISNPAVFGPTLMMGGNNRTHTQQSDAGVLTNRGNSVMAAATVLQFSNPQIIPAINVSNYLYGTAPGAASVTSVGNADGMVDLFNSAATRAGGVLSQEPNAALFKAHYDALLSLNRAAGLESTERPFGVGKTAGFVVGKNFAELLSPTFNDLERYGLNGGTDNDAGLDGRVQEFGKFLITTAKMFANGLSSITMGNFFNDDPHGAFNAMAASQNRSMAIGRILGAFFADLQADDPYCPGTPIFQNTVVAIQGDTTKNPLTPGGWPDGTPGGTNWIWAWLAGHGKTGQFGEIRRDGTVQGWNPGTGALDGGMTSAALSPEVAGILLHAIARADTRSATTFGDYTVGGIAKLDVNPG